jgi:hypothetical protein
VELGHAVLQRLNAASSAVAFNPYIGDDEGSATRRHNLSLYLQRMAERRPRLMLLGEAPGYRGCRVTGVPFTSEAILLTDDCPFGLFGTAVGFRGIGGRWQRESSATAMWDALSRMGTIPLLWNAYPYHPHQPDQPDSNRPPTAAELASGREIVFLLLELFAIEQVIAVGNKAAIALERWGVRAAKVRHPAHGGQAIFRRELEAVLSERASS